MHLGFSKKTERFLPKPKKQRRVRRMAATAPAYDAAASGGGGHGGGERRGRRRRASVRVSGRGSLVGWGGLGRRLI